MHSINNAVDYSQSGIIIYIDIDVIVYNFSQKVNEIANH